MAWHAKLSASTSKRWINCPASVQAIARLYEDNPRLKEADEASPYAREGTAAHHVLEFCLASLNEKAWTPERNGEITDPRSLLGGAVTENGTVFSASQVIRMSPDWHEITDDMAGAVGAAVDFILSELERLGPGTLVFTERRWDMTWLHPDLGGTSDLTLNRPFEELVVLDYKHGKGVVVEVVEEDGTLNEQGMTYLLGAAKDDGFSHERYTIGILQPRAPHHDGAMRTATVSRKELLAFQEGLRSAAHETQSPDAQFNPGKWCKSSFCPLNGRCAAQDAMVQQQAQADFDDFPLENHAVMQAESISCTPFTPEEIAVKLAWVPVIDSWCKGVQNAAMSMALAGVAIPGQKLVRKKSNRKLIDPGQLRADAEAAGLDPLRLYNEPKPKSPAQVEKLGKAYKSLVNAKTDGGAQVYWMKPEGKITLAPESDPREAVDPSAVADFDTFEEESEE